MKAEMESSADEKMNESDFVSTFDPNETHSFNASDENKYDLFPVAINPGFDLQCLVLYGTPLRGAFYEDKCTLRVQDMAKIKANKMVMTKTKWEIALVRPGFYQDHKDTDDFDHERLKFVDVMMVQKAKGKSVLYKLPC